MKKAIEFTHPVKKAIICKNVQSTTIVSHRNSTCIPIAGDVAIFKVLELGKHTRIQTESGRNALILPGDYIMAAFGNRYATGQIEGYVPSLPLDIYDILGQGGVVGRATSINSAYEEVGTTQVELVGYVVDENLEIINTQRIAGPLDAFQPPSPIKEHQVFLSLGTSMDSGKTSSAGFLSHGLFQAGKKSAYIKLTGTVYTKDKNFVKDYGAEFVCDFSEYGYPSTYMCSTEELLDLFQSLYHKALETNPDYVIIEIADGLLERETNALIAHEEFKKHIDGVLFSAGDSMSAIGGANHLVKLGYHLIGITGLMSASPLLVKEVNTHSAYPVLTREELMSADIHKFITQAQNKAKRLL